MYCKANLNNNNNIKQCVTGNIMMMNMFSGRNPMDFNSMFGGNAASAQGANSQTGGGKEG